MQLRFYEYPGKPYAPWPSTEWYSIYTAAKQGGLEMADLDGDGRPVLFCGNYWVRSTASFDLPWRIFAINLLHREPADPAELWQQIPMAENNGAGSRLVCFPGRKTTTLSGGVHTLIPNRKGALAIGPRGVAYLRK